MTNTLIFLPSLLAVFILILLVKAASVALRLTGMEERKANFQALSALTGTGFSTKESELIMNNPARRRIISLLMILGYGGVITIIISFSTSIINSHGNIKYAGVLIFLVGLYLIYLFATYKGFTKRWDNFIKKKLIKSPVFEEAPIEDLLRLMEGYGLVRVLTKKKSIFINRHIKEINLTRKNILILGIDRHNSWNPIPKGEEKILEGDKLVVYGPIKVINEIFKTPE